MKIFRDYDQAGLDSQLNLRARWPEHLRYFERWARDSAAARARLPARLDLAYGETTAETLDLFPVEGAAAAPLLVFIHGGYWQGLDKSDFSYLAPSYVEAGVAFASLNYALAPAATIGTMIGQVRRALVWMHAHAGDLGIDAERVVVSGHSAGGHLAAMALSTYWPDVAPGLPGNLLAGGCAVSGIYDLEPIRLSYHNKVLNVAPDDVERWSPLHCLPVQAPPLLLAVGSEETDEFLRQQAEYAGAWLARGLRVGEVEMAGLHHFTAVDALGQPEHPLYAATHHLLTGRLA